MNGATSPSASQNRVATGGHLEGPHRFIKGGCVCGGILFFSVSADAAQTLESVIKGVFRENKFFEFISLFF